MKIFLATLFSIFALVSSHYERGSPVCMKLKSVYDTVCPPPPPTTTTTTTTRTTTTTPAVTCLVRYSGKCFWIESKPNSEIRFDEGKAMCKKNGGVPANIYSKSHYDMVYKKLKAIAATADGQAFVWLGMRFDYIISTNAVLYNGQPAPYTRWHAGYPNGDYGPTQITLVAKSSSTANQHMHNWKATTITDQRRGILCEK